MMDDKTNWRVRQRNLSFMVLVFFAEIIVQVSSDGRNIPRIRNPTTTLTRGGDSSKVSLIKMHENLTQVPYYTSSATNTGDGGDTKNQSKNNKNVISLNLGYNMIETLDERQFLKGNYKNVRKIYMFHNRLENIEELAFEGLRQLRFLDLSDNRLASVHPHTFLGNAKLTQLILAKNALRFERDAKFLHSLSIETLILSNNAIVEIYAATFSGLPNLKRLALTDNRRLRTLAPTCFVNVQKLRYLSLGNTAVVRLSEGMFKKLPKLINLDQTPLGNSFEPPLKHITEKSVTKLLTFLKISSSSSSTSKLLQSEPFV